MGVLETSRLILREFIAADAPFILDLLNTPSWLEFIGDRGVKTLDEATLYLVNGPMMSYKKSGFGLYMVELKNDHTPIGTCGLIKRDSLEDIDIGFALLPDYEKKGYAFEAASAVLSHAEKVLGLKRVVAITTKKNINSIHLLKKLDLTFEKMIQLPFEDTDLMLFATQWL